MARKSSKTAHVMNLLAGEDSESPKSEAARENLAARQTSDSTETIKELTVLAQQASIQTKEGPLTPSPISIIDMSSSAPDPVAEMIKQQLEKEEGIEDNTLSSAGEEPLPEESSEENLIPEVITPVTNERENTTRETAGGNDTAPDPEPEIPVPQAPTYRYLNIMEHVVKSKVEEYMQKFDVCTCGRCIADVTALALTHLPPKYIVVEAPSASPLLNFYTNRFSQQVIVELTKACSTVKENPHH
ncbi:late competence development ComFB family protein [Lachnospiraceae bacterium 54-53]